MITQATTPRPLECAAVVRILVESRMLSGTDLLNLACTNKAVFRVVYEERKRDRIKRLPFFGIPRNPLVTPVLIDFHGGLKEALELAEFEKDTASPNGQLIHADGGRGIHMLLDLCIKHGAVKCLNLLLRRTDNPSSPSPFTVDCMVLYESAVREALRYGRLEAVLYLHGRDKNHVYPDPVPLYTTFLEQARSPAAVRWLASRMPKDTDYLPILVALCGNRYAQPAVIEELIDLVPEKKLSSIVSNDGEGEGIRSRKPTTALCAAAAALHLPALVVLLRSGARGFDPADGTDSNCATPNPLVRALAYPWPAKPPIFADKQRPSSPSSSTDSDSDVDDTNNNADQPALTEEEAQAQLEVQQKQRAAATRRARREWQTKLHRLAGSMHVAVTCLLEAATADLGDGTAQQQHALVDMLDRTAVGFVRRLRVLLLGNVEWLLLSAAETDEAREGARKVVDKLLCCAPQHKGTGIVSVWDAAVAAGEFEPEVEPEADKVEVVWHPLLTGSEVRTKLRAAGMGLPAKLEEIWNLLLTPTTVELAARYLVFHTVSSAPRNSVDLLWDLLVATERRSSQDLTGWEEIHGASSGSEEEVCLTPPSELESDE